MAWIAALILLAATAAYAFEPAADMSQGQAAARASSVTWDLLARGLISAGQFDAAEAVLDDHLKSDPKDVQARFLTLSRSRS